MLRPARRWRAAALYLAAVLLANAIWEIAQLPFYTIWQERPREEAVRAALHCTLGDAGIAIASLLLAIAAVGRRGWLEPGRFRRTAAATVLLAVAYTIISEWMNVSVRANWAYAEAMPVVPLLGIGLLPLLQWVVTPALGFWLIRPRRSPA